MEVVAAIGAVPSLIGGVLGIIDVTGRCITLLADLRSRFKDVPIAVESMSAQLSTLRAALEQIRFWIEQDLALDNQHYQLTMDLGTAIRCCKLHMDFLRDQLSAVQYTDADEMTFKSRVNLVLEGRGIENCLTRLDRQTHALNLLITAFQRRDHKEQKAVLQSPRSRKLFGQLEEDSSSLIVIYDGASFVTDRTVTSTNTSQFSLRPHLDTEILRAKVYKSTLTSLMKRATRRHTGVASAPQQSPPAPLIPDFSIDAKAQIQRKESLERLQPPAVVGLDIDASFNFDLSQVDHSAYLKYGLPLNRIEHRNMCGLKTIGKESPMHHRIENEIRAGRHMPPLATKDTAAETELESAEGIPASIATWSEVGANWNAMSGTYSISVSPGLMKAIGDPIDQNELEVIAGCRPFTSFDNQRSPFEFKLSSDTRVTLDFQLSLWFRCFIDSEHAIFRNSTSGTYQSKQGCQTLLKFTCRSKEDRYTLLRMILQARPIDAEAQASPSHETKFWQNDRVDMLQLSSNSHLWRTVSAKRDRHDATSPTDADIFRVYLKPHLLRRHGAPQNNYELQLMLRMSNLLERGASYKKLEVQLLLQRGLNPIQFGPMALYHRPFDASLLDPTIHNHNYAALNVSEEKELARSYSYAGGSSAESTTGMATFEWDFLHERPVPGQLLPPLYASILRTAHPLSGGLNARSSPSIDSSATPVQKSPDSQSFLANVSPQERLAKLESLPKPVRVAGSDTPQKDSPPFTALPNPLDLITEARPPGDAPGSAVEVRRRLSAASQITVLHCESPDPNLLGTGKTF
ncbi:uncharacterized protein HMPREF1541_00995 [Cyphellophora europaea CBS 101466]|uniref:Fungal N-terminal domain-containing protein n=1 Tax=Cyphellophora europaea (strain CBS 101466) TaxID=1220924 RepID=W2SDJ7_CYPE1|nr:uncharacterized protein HMPREF1541_00995 [Cyphellophora europaea CBS 101466]ETN46806.1 hypothetical protein HMPREF1541_00995 [Cyphellophora europaea CBS 101466]